MSVTEDNDTDGMCEVTLLRGARGGLARTLGEDFRCGIHDICVRKAEQVLLVHGFLFFRQAFQDSSEDVSSDETRHFSDFL